MWGYGWYGMPFMWISIALGVVLLIAALLVLAWWANRSVTTPRDRDHSTALDVLARRYANGEVDEATFERMRAQLHDTPTHDAGRSTDRERVGA